MSRKDLQHIKLEDKPLTSVNQNAIRSFLTAEDIEVFIGMC